MKLIKFVATSILLAVPAFGYAAAYDLEVSFIGADGKDQTVTYNPLTNATKAWSLCVSLPHLKDPMYLGLNYGMVEEAKRLGVRMQTFDAGGYGGLNTQISQIETCVAGGGNAVVVAGVATDGLNNLITKLKSKGVPVVDAVNGVSSKDVGARVIFSAFDDGLKAGEYIAKRFPAGSKPVKVALLPGPAGAGFVEAQKAGYLKGIEGSAVQTVEIKYGDLGKEVQARLVEDLLQAHKDVNFIVGSAVTAEAAVPVLRARKLTEQVKLVSMYTTPGVFQHVKSKTIEAAGLMPVVLAGRASIDTAVRLLENKVEFSHIKIRGAAYDTTTVNKVDASRVLAPNGFRPVFMVDGK